jgi:ABC-2 type transport system ATP-binding protein
MAAPHDGTPGPTTAPRRQLAVELVGVGHRFGDNEALKDLHLVAPLGRITVVLGPNGAGKTTAMRMMTGALVPDEGLVRTFGLEPRRDGHRVRPRCGVVSAKPALYDRLSGRDNLRYAAELHDVREGRDRRIEETAERFGIAGALEDLVGRYSTGMKTRLALARSVLHDPELLLFDEPTSGLDPESSVAVLNLIREMTSGGRTVVMCTHLLSEAEGLADEVVIMEGGTDLTAGTPAELTRAHWPHPVVAFDAEDSRLLDRMRAWPGVMGYRRDPSGARVEVDDLQRVPEIVGALVADGVRLTRVEPHRPTLEDLYFAARRQLSDGARRDGREVLGVLDPVQPAGPARVAPVPPTALGAAPRGREHHMPTLSVPDALDPDEVPPAPDPSGRPEQGRSTR